VLEPVKRFYNFLVNQGLWSKQQEEHLAETFSQEIDQAVNTYLTMPPQPATAIVDYHYETWPENLQDQRDELGAISYA
jgi:pyruvate dehydrogenase E1 component alpha subunit